MFDFQRQAEVRRLLFRYLESPSLRHLKDPKQVDRLAEEIVSAVDRSSPLWTKWDATRAELLKASAKTWIPIKDLVVYLNTLPGRPLPEQMPCKGLGPFRKSHTRTSTQTSG